MPTTCGSHVWLTSASREAQAKPTTTNTRPAGRPRTGRQRTWNSKQERTLDHPGGPGQVGVDTERIRWVDGRGFGESSHSMSSSARGGSPREGVVEFSEKKKLGAVGETLTQSVPRLQKWLFSLGTLGSPSALRSPLALCLLGHWGVLGHSKESPPQDPGRPQCPRRLYCPRTS